MFNCEKYIKEAIQSAILQTYKNKEIIIVDDGSTDGTKKILKQYEKHLTVIYKENGGTASALNAGIKASHGDWIKWLSADDVLHNEAVTNMIEFIKYYPENKNCIFYTDYYYIDSSGVITGEFIETNQNERSQEERNKTLWMYFFGNGSSSLIHKSIFEKVGLFDESFKGGEDYEFWLRACLVYDIRLYLIQIKSLYYRRHPDQLTHKVEWGTVDPKLKNHILKLLKEKGRIIG